MARQRILHPEFFTDADLLSLSPLHRLLFAGLWCAADREGRLLDKPRDLKLRLLPGDACDVDQMLADLAGLRMVARYEVDGVACLSLPGFLKRQKPHPRETKSLLPPPPAKANLGEPKANLGEPAAPSMSSLPSVSVSVSESVSVSVSGDQRKAAEPVGALRDGWDVLFRELRAAAYVWSFADERAVEKLLGLGDTAEILRRGRICLEHEYPRWSTVVDLARKWNECCAAANPPARAGPQTQADKDAEHRAKHGVIPGVNAPCRPLNLRPAK